MIISVQILIAIVVLLVLALVTPLFSPFSRKVTLPDEEVDANDDSRPEYPPVSIIITVHDNASQLSQIIDRFLEQDYPEDFQVVVVVDENDHDSIDVLKQHGSNENLYYTKLPVSSRYLSRKKLAMTVGMRAAKYDWCILTSVYCSPISNHWLRTFCKSMARNNRRLAMSSTLRTQGSQPDVVLGMTPYEVGTPAFYRYEHLRTMLYHLHSAETGTAFSTNQLLVAIHKNEFFRQQGFSGNLEYQRAEFEFLVNKFAKKGSTALAITPDSWLSCRRPTKKQWNYRHMHGIDSFHDMKRSSMFFLLFNTDLWLMHIYNLLTCIAVIVGLLKCVDDCALDDFTFMNTLLPGSYLNGIMLAFSSLLFWIISQVIRIRIYRKKLSYFGNVSSLRAISFDWFISIHNVFIRLKYMFTDKYDFMTHRL